MNDIRTPRTRGAHRGPVHQLKHDTWTQGAFTPPDGVARPPSRDVMTMFMVEQGGQWRIVSAHSTPLDEGAQRVDPVGRQ